MRGLLIALLLGTACTQDSELHAQKRELGTTLATFDAGMVPVDDRQTLQVFLASTGQGEVSVYDISVDDPDHWQVSTSWINDDTDDDGNPDGMIIPGGAEDDPEYGLVEIIFKPDSEAEFRTVMTITSNDSEVEERTDDDNGIWKVVLRGIGRYPCARIYPNFNDFGPQPAGGYYSSTAIIENCGGVKVTISDFDLVGSPSFTVETQTPFYVLPNDSEEIELGYVPSGGSPAEGSEVLLDSNSPALTDTITLIGNDCALSSDTEWDADNDSWFSCGGDCDDDDPTVHPGAQERENDDTDDNCDGSLDVVSNSTANDDDGDGYSEDEGDCDDANASINPGETETINQIDDDCNGAVDDKTDWYDDDRDGFSERQGDCDDTNRFIFPGAEDIQNDTDDDCDDQIDEGTYNFDDDFDGFAEIEPSGEPDCDDNDPWSFPGASEDCDGRDNDCDGLVDEGVEDEPDGACSFLVTRTETLTEEGGGCSTVGKAALAPVLALMAMGLIVRRREESA